MAEEVGVSEHVFILHDEAQQGDVRVDDVELADVVPRRVQTVVVVVARLVFVVRVVRRSDHLYLHERRRNAATRLRQVARSQDLQASELSGERRSV